METATPDVDALTPTSEPAPPAGDPSPEIVEHLAMCSECDVRVRYRPSSSGTSFALVDHTEQTFGVGAHGRPTCPNDHGEMGIADEQLPAGEAITRVATELKPRLPFPAPPFNYEGVLHAIQKKRHQIKQLERNFDRAKEDLKEAREELEEANKALGKMIDEAEQHEQERLQEVARREAAAAARHPDDTNLVRCTWEQANAGHACSICADVDEFRTVMGAEPPARDSEAHVDMVRAYETRVEVLDLESSLQDDADLQIPPNTILGWTADERAEVTRWIEEDCPATPRPSVLGTAHIAAAVEDGASVQACRECGAVLLRLGDADVEDDPWPAGTLVGVDCPGAGQVYPKPDESKKRTRKARA